MYTAILIDPETGEYEADFARPTIKDVWECVENDHDPKSPFKVVVIAVYNRMAYYRTAAVLDACKGFELLKGKSVDDVMLWFQNDKNRAYIDSVVLSPVIDNFTLEDKETAAYIKNNDVTLVKSRLGNLLVTSICRTETKDGDLTIIPLAVVVTPELLEQLTPIYASSK